MKNETTKLSDWNLNQIGETEKAVKFEVEVEIPNLEKTAKKWIWIPKSLIKEGEVPNWFLGKKFREVLDNVAEFYRTGGMIFGNDGMVMA